MAAWIRDRAAEHDASVALAAPVTAMSPSVAGHVIGLDDMLQRARIPRPAAEELKAEICGLGAVHVRELTHADWQMLEAWGRLREMERRRVLSAVQFDAR